MIEMSHQQIKNLIQAAADTSLPPKEREALNQHLSSCEECRKYAKNLDSLQASLRHMLRQRWDGQKPSLSVREIKERSGKVASRSQMLLTFGKLGLIPLLVLALFIAYRATGTQDNLPTVSAQTIPAPGDLLYTPTPPARSTATKPAALACEQVTYFIQENDTLEGIAARFSVTKEAIRAFNGMSSDTLDTRTYLIIPLCQSTSTPTTTTTITP